MTTKHKLRTWLPVNGGDDEIEVEIHFTHLKGAKPSWDDPGWGAEVEFVAVVPLDGKGRPMRFMDYHDHKQDTLNEIAFNWLESDEGYGIACATVEDDDDAGREYAADLRVNR